MSQVGFYDMIYLLTAIGLPPGGRSTVHIYTQTIHAAIQNKQYIEQHNNFGIMFYTLVQDDWVFGIILYV